MAGIYKYDLFVSHAFEDKNSFANDLATELTKTGLKVWYSGYQLKLGDSIAGSINQALKDAAFGIVIISPVYLQKKWAMAELNALIAQETKQNKILPILHNITVDEIREHFPILADRYTVSSDTGMEFVLRKVLQAMKGIQPTAPGAGISKPEGKTKRASSGKNVNANKNTNEVTVNNEGGGGMFIVVVVIILIVAAYFFYQGSGIMDSDGVNKENSTPANSN